METVLGDYLQSVFVEELESLSSMLADFDKGTLNFVASNMNNASAKVDFAKTLASKVTGDINVESFLGNVLVASNLDAAMTMRSTLSFGQSIVTPDGIWIGSNWLRISKDHAATPGVIKR